MKIRVLDGDDLEQSWELSRLAFGGNPESTPQAGPAGYDVGAFDDAGRLLARVLSRPYEQWWGGQRVPMAGIAGVAVLPERRGQGLVQRLMAEVVREAEQPISVLYPTASKIYRRSGWEVVGTLDDTVISLSALPRGKGASLRAATIDDAADLQALYDVRGAATSGLLTRDGPSFPRGADALLEHDVVTVAVEEGHVTGYLAYDRGRGYRAGAQLRVWDCLCATPGAQTGLVDSLASWSSVADTIRWRGSTGDLGHLMEGSVPAPSEVQPWMLRVLDPVAAVAARGFASGTTQAAFSVEGTGFRLDVEGGRGLLVAVEAADLPTVTWQGLALLYAGVAQGRLLRNGFVDRPVPGLEEAFAGPVPEILDYF